MLGTPTMVYDCHCEVSDANQSSQNKMTLQEQQCVRIMTPLLLALRSSLKLFVRVQLSFSDEQTAMLCRRAGELTTSVAITESGSHPPDEEESNVCFQFPNCELFGILWIIAGIVSHDAAFHELVGCATATEKSLSRRSPRQSRRMY